MDKTSQYKDTNNCNFEIENILHDFKTPVTVIQTAIQLIETQSKNLPESVNQNISIIKKNCLYMQRFLKGFKELKNISNGNINTNFKKQDIIILTKEIIESISNIAEAKKINIRFIPFSNTFNVILDKNIYTRIMLNLLSNSIKFCNQNDNIYISINLSENKDLFKINIKDTGKGISEDIIKTIFERYSVENILYDNTGCGIGLNIVKTLVEMHHGTIKVNLDNKEKGTEFIILLPIKLNESHTNQKMYIKDFYFNTLHKDKLYKNNLNSY